MSLKTFFTNLFRTNGTESGNNPGTAVQAGEPDLAASEALSGNNESPVVDEFLQTSEQPAEKSVEPTNKGEEAKKLSRKERKMNEAKTAVDNAEKEVGEKKGLLEKLKETLTGKKSEVKAPEKPSIVNKTIEAYRKELESGKTLEKLIAEDKKSFNPRGEDDIKKIVKYLEDEQEYNKKLLELEKAGKEYLAANKDYCEALRNEVSANEKYLKYLEENSDDAKKVKDAINNAKKGITGAGDEANSVLKDIMKPEEIKKAMEAKKGLGKGKWALIGAGVALVTAGVLLLCNRKKDKQEEVTEEEGVPAAEEEGVLAEEEGIPAEEEGAPANGGTEGTENKNRFEYNPGADFTITKEDGPRGLWGIIENIYREKDPNFSSLPYNEQNRRIANGVRRLMKANGLTYTDNSHYYVMIKPGQIIKQVELEYLD